MTAAQAAQVFHAHGTFSTTDTVCGIPDVAIDIQSDQNTVTNADGSFKTTGAFRQTFTNPVNGKAVIVYTAGQSPARTAYVFDSAANTVTFDLTYKGLPEKIQAPNGPVLIRDAGNITLKEVFDRGRRHRVSRAHPRSVDDPRPVSRSGRGRPWRDGFSGCRGSSRSRSPIGWLVDAAGEGERESACGRGH
jgi:hypothetical protein